jgi:MoxR-like ATPase
MRAPNIAHTWSWLWRDARSLLPVADNSQVSGLPADIDATESLFATGNYVAGRDLATVVFLALSMGRPILLEGEAGVGKTEIAKVLSTGLNRDLIRLQCYEGLDLANAAYEWNYPRQMVAIRIAEAEGRASSISDDLYSSEFLVERPLLSALQPHANGPPVLLIDEIDRADEPFEAFLLEMLSDFQISIPELGTIQAESPPIVVITSNRTREVHDALRRRCLYHWVDYPSAEAETQVVRLKAPDVGADLGSQLVQFVQELRAQDLFKRPGVAETLDWASALTQLNVVTLTPDVINDTLGALLKYQDDIAKIQGSEAARMLAEIQAAA